MRELNIDFVDLFKSVDRFTSEIVTKTRRSAGFSLQLCTEYGTIDTVQ